MPYWRLPDRLYDEPDEFTEWAVSAFDVARRAAPTGRSGKAGREEGRRQTDRARSSRSRAAKSRRPTRAPGKTGEEARGEAALKLDPGSVSQSSLGTLTGRRRKSGMWSPMPITAGPLSSR